MPGLMAKALPWLLIVGLLVGTYGIWRWAAGGGISRLDRAKIVFFAVLLLALAIVALSKVV